MELITTILNRKQFYFHTVSPATVVTDALQQMHCENVDYLVVLDEADRFRGILSDHDIACRLVLEKRPLNKTLVGEVMNTKLPVATTDDTVERCMKMMRQHHVRFIPIFENFEFKGVVSMDDILSEVVDSKKNVFDEEEDETFMLA